MKMIESYADEEVPFYRPSLAGPQRSLQAEV